MWCAHLQHPAVAQVTLLDLKRDFGQRACHPHAPRAATPLPALHLMLENLREVILSTGLAHKGMTLSALN